MNTKKNKREGYEEKLTHANCRGNLIKWKKWNTNNMKLVGFFFVFRIPRAMPVVQKSLLLCVENDNLI